jgi:hypothetical protein
MQMFAKWQGKGKEWEDVIGGFVHSPVNTAFHYASLVNAGGFYAKIHTDTDLQ